MAHRGNRNAWGRAGAGSGIAALLGALLLAAPGCALQTSSQIGAAGIAPADSDRLSLAVAQARAKSPERSAPGLTYSVHESKPPAAKPELALQGDGEGFSRGLQLTDRSKASLRLFLDKTSYASGYASVRIDGGEAQTWPIVAYELRGKPTGSFEFTYLLTPPGGGLRYLVLLGGTAGSGAAETLAYEGTLIEPTPGKPLDEWARAFKFDFGFKYPAHPAYQAQVNEADALFHDLQRDASALEALSERAQRAAADADAAQAAPADAPRRGPDPATLADRAQDAKAQLAQRAAETQARVLHYYEVRRALDTAYADFVGTNPYTWRDRAGQVEFYKRWQTVEFHHPRIDELVQRLLPFVPDPKKLETARKEAMDQFARTNNWDKNPEQTKPAPKGNAGPADSGSK